MHLKTNLLFAFFALLLTRCGSYSERQLASPIDGLSCRAYTGSFEDGMAASQAMECYYTCPGETIGPLYFEGDPSLSATKGDLDRRFCDIAPQASSTQTPISTSSSPTPIASPTPTLQASATAEISPTAQLPFLTGNTSMCDLGERLINFRIVESAPDLTGKTLEVQIQEQPVACYVNPVNPSLLTCSIPNVIRFPARIVVSLDGAMVNDFVYSGVGCLVLPTQTSTPRPIISYP